MKRILISLTCIIGCISLPSNAQVGIGTTDIHSSAIMELQTKSKGFLMPRMTTLERNDITAPEEGLMVYNTDRNAMQFFRKNVGTTGTENGWYDTRCNSDITAAIASFPGGLTLDFSDLSQYGQFYPQTNGGGTAFTSSTPNGTPFNSIGPIPENITGGTAVTHLNENTGSQEVNTDVYVLTNENIINDYNAATFASRNVQYSLGIDNSGHYLTANLDDYSGSFDLVLVAKFDILPTAKNESFFNTGNGSGSVQIGVGENSGTCDKETFTMQIASKRLCGDSGDYPTVEKDSLFHRFRIKYTFNNNGGNNSVDYYMDGKLMDTHTGGDINGVTVYELTLFTNKLKRRFPASSIAFLGLYPVHLTNANFEALDKYLACKFEGQP